MPPTRHSTRASTRASSRKQVIADDEDDVDEQPQQLGEEDEDGDAAQPARRSSRRTSHASPQKQQRKSSASKRRRTADDGEDEDDEAEEAGQDPDDTATSSRRGGRKSAASHTDKNDGSDAEEGVADKWKMIEKTQKAAMPDAVTNAAKAIGKQAILKKAADLSRLALYHEYNKGPLRRQVINQHIFSSDTREGRVFPMVLRYCNRTLRGTFALELVELKPGVTASSSSYILCNVLPAAAISGLVKPSKTLQTLAADANSTRKRPRSSAGDATAHAAEAAAAEQRRKYVGHRNTDPLAPPLDWKAADGQLGSMGLLYVVLGLILVNGRTLPNSQLRSQLRRLCLSGGEPLPVSLRIDGNTNKDAPFPSRSSLTTSAPKSIATEANNATIESFLALAAKLHYLEHAKSSGPFTQAADAATQDAPRRRGGRPGVPTGDGDGDGEDSAAAAFDWTWGPRAKIEVGETAIAAFIAEVWGLGADEEDEAAAAAEQEEDEEEEEEGDDEEGEDAAAQRRRKKAQTAAAKRRAATQTKNETPKDREKRIVRDVMRAAGGSFES